MLGIPADFIGIGSTYRVIPTVRKHVIASQTLASSNSRIRIDKSAHFGVIISALEVVEPAFCIVNIPTVVQGIAAHGHLAQSAAVVHIAII